jgi:hypothetical protein
MYIGGMDWQSIMRGRWGLWTGWQSITGGRRALRWSKSSKAKHRNGWKFGDFEVGTNHTRGEFGLRFVLV